MFGKILCCVLIALFGFLAIKLFLGLINDIKERRKKRNSKATADEPVSVENKKEELLK